MEALILWFRRVMCNHTDSVTLRNDDYVEVRYCNSCESVVYRNKQKWWQR